MGEGYTLTVGDVAEQLGVTVKTIRVWADSGQLPHLRVGKGHRRFRQADIDAITGHRR